jgi:diapolycopene oxygenase
MFVTKIKVAVVGAGIAGLASAIRLQHKGYQVHVFDTGSVPGGKMGERFLGKYRFDTGPSLFTRPDLVDELFSLCGLKSDEYFHYKPLDVVCHYFYPDGLEFRAPAGKDALASAMEQSFGEPAQNVRRFFRKSAFLYRITAPVFLERSLHRLDTYIRPSGLRGIMNLPFIDMFRSMAYRNERSFNTPYAQQFFNRFATYNGSSPYKAPATLNVIPHLETELGAFYPQGGMVQIARSLHQLAERIGVQFHFNSKVKQILVEQGHVTGLALESGAVFHAPMVLSNADVYHTYRHLLPVPMPKRVAEVDSSSSALIFYWGIKKQFPQLGLHNIFFSEDYRKEFDQIWGQRSTPEDPTVYVNITSKCDPSDAPEYGENWFVMVNVPANDGHDWAQLRKDVRCRVLQKLSSLLKVNLESLIEEEDVLDPVLIEARTSSFRGALYGSSSNKRMAAFFRQRNKSEQIGGLYFAGGSVHPGGGIPLCLLSAKIAASLTPAQRGV